MPITRVLAPTWEQQIANAIGSRNTQADTTIGPIRDIISYPVSLVCDTLNSNIVYLSQLLSLQNVNQFATSDLAAIAYNDQVIPGPGTFATVVVSLLSTSPPTSNVTLSVNFPFSTEPDPQTGATVFFASTQQVQYIAANANNYYDSVNRVYRLDVPCQCTAIGTIGNVGPNTIVNSQRSIGGFQTVTNFTGALGGTTAESNQDVANTLLIFNLGVNEISTPYGIGLETQRQFPQITDYIVVYGNDPLLIRASTDAGATDVYVVGSNAISASDSFIYNGQPMVLSHQPVAVISSVVDGATTYVAGVNYNFVPDLTGPYGGSIQGKDQVQFLSTSPLFPAIGDTVTINYIYNQLISQIQTFFTSPKYQAIGRSLLYKQGQALQTVTSGTLTVLPGFDPSTVQAAVATAILAYVNSLGLGQALDQFNLITFIGQTVGSAGGIDNFVLTLFNVLGQSGVLSSIIPTEAQYCQAQQANVNVFLG